MSKNKTKFKKQRYEFSSIKLVKNSKQTFSTNLFKQVFFIKIGSFFGVSAGQNTTLSSPQDVFSCWNPFDNCLIVKKLESQKMTHPIVQFTENSVQGKVYVRNVKLC